jgi:hypothetical protein
MGMFGNLIGSAIGGTFSLIGGVGGSILSNKGYGRALDIIDDRSDYIAQRRRENLDHMKNKYYQDPTQTAESQAAVTQGQQLLDEQTERARAGKTITGASDESIALQKGTNSAVVGNMIQQQAVEGARNKENIYNNYVNQENNLESEMDNWQRYKADTQKARYLTQAQNFVNTANAHGASHVEFGKSLPW